MSMERRGRQNLNLATGTQVADNSNWHEHKEDRIRMDSLPNHWARIGFAAQDKELVFENLIMHINEDSLREAFKAIDGSKAMGVDNISKAEYGQNLQENLKDLAQRVQKGTYRPQPKREVLIPKGKSKTRPIAISCFEDKLVDWVVGKILSIVFEPLFIRNSFGYRPNKSADGAVKACYNSLCKNMRKHVVEIDFASFFNTIPHRKLMRAIGRKISEKRFKGLIGRFLKAELITKQGTCLPGVIGTPQGSIMSPILANIYLNEVIDQWFIKNYASYHNIMVRYADDALFFFKEDKTAEIFLNDLDERVKLYGLTLNKDKTHIVTIAKENHRHFHFLGFTFYWGIQGCRRILKVKTHKEKLVKAFKEFDQWIKMVRNRMKLKQIWKLARSKLIGHINYFGYWMNALKLNHFYQQVINSLFKWLNRRSQKRSYTWDGFEERLRNFPLMEPIEVGKLKQLGWNPYD